MNNCDKYNYNSSKQESIYVMLTNDKDVPTVVINDRYICIT